MQIPDEKELAIICMTILGLGALLTFNVEGLSVSTHIVTGIAGIVTGKALSKKGD